MNEIDVERHLDTEFRERMAADNVSIWSMDPSVTDTEVTEDEETLGSEDTGLEAAMADITVNLPSESSSSSSSDGTDEEEVPGDETYAPDSEETESEDSETPVPTEPDEAPVSSESSSEMTPSEIAAAEAWEASALASMEASEAYWDAQNEDNDNLEDFDDDMVNFDIRSVATTIVGV